MDDCRHIKIVKQDGYKEVIMYCSFQYVDQMTKHQYAWTIEAWCEDEVTVDDRKVMTLCLISR